MAMHHGVLPRTLHVDEPSSQVDWSLGAVSLLTEQRPWEPYGDVRRVGVSSFGISGTNAHVILEESPEGGVFASRVDGVVDDSCVVSVGAVPWVLSAKDGGALRAQAGRLGAYLSENPDLRVQDVGVSLVSTRSVFEHRAVVFGKDRAGLLEELGWFGGGSPSLSVLEGIAAGDAGGVAFLFTGQGAQRVGMGSELYGSFGVFRDAFDGVCGYLDGLLGCSLRDVVFGGSADHGVGGLSERPLLDETLFTQTGLFAFEVALFRLLESLDVRPDYLIGHSVGELVAAYVAGVFSLEDACVLVAARGRLMGELPTGGAMAAVQASEREIVESLVGFEGRVALAAVNGPMSVVFSGDEDAVLELMGVWGERGRKVKRLLVSHAFHSSRMDGMLEGFADVARGLSFSEPSIPVVSNLTGEAVVGEELRDPGYWVRHARETVRFADGVRWLAAQGVGSFVELGPDGVLGAMVGECFAESAGEGGVQASVVLNSDGVLAGDGVVGGDDVGQSARVVVSLSRAGREEEQTLLAGVAGLWVRGVSVGWGAVFEGSGARRVGLPTYAFQRERFWLDGVGRGGGDARALGQASSDHPLLGAAVALAGERGLVLTGRLSLVEHSWLSDHVVMGRVLLPGTAFLELALCAGAEVGCGVVRELVLQAPLVLGERELQLQVVVGEGDESGARSVRVYSRAESVFGDLDGDGEWVCHATGSLAPVGFDGEVDRGVFSVGGVWPPVGAEPVSMDDVYSRLADSGLEYGPVFQGLTRAWRCDGEVFAEVVLRDVEREQAGTFGLHPALLDAALHAIALLGSSLEGGADAVAELRLPFSWSDVSLLRPGPSALRVRITPQGDESVSLLMSGEDGYPIASVGGLATRVVSAAEIGERADGREGAMFDLDWVEQNVSSCGSPGESVMLATCATSVSDQLGSAGVECRLFADMAGFAEAVDSDRVDGTPRALLLDARAPALVSASASETAAVADVPNMVRVSLHGVLDSLQGWLADERLSSCRLVVLTEGAIAVGVDEGVSDLAGGAVWGLVRSAQTENPGRFVLVDLDDEGSSWSALHQALCSDEPQLALRGGTVRLPRLASVHSGEALILPGDGNSWRMDVERRGTLESLAVVPGLSAGTVLEPGQVRVEVRAAGLNFRDVLIALGMYPGSASIGAEGSGVVVEVGEAVHDLAPGDRVMGLIEGAMGDFALVDSRLLVSMPREWSFVEAASAPIAFATAYYGLVDLADLRTNERLLVHAAAGGVGIAAVQLARHLGAEVYGTASPGKWDTLRALDLAETHIASSRTLDFVDELLAGTDRRGMDVVLNSLAGEFVDGSLELLGNGGRFLEMGKTDVRDPGQIASEHEGVDYRAFDVMDAGADRLQEILRELLGLFEGGALVPAPITTWSIRRARQAFRHMSQGKHVGKNVLRLPRSIDPERTVLLTGGTGGLGSLVARHLVAKHGVRHLVLVSRQGGQANGASELVDELSALGAQASAVACDISDREQVKCLLAEVSREHPLDAVLHAAGVIDDGVIDSLTPDRIDRVLAPKLAGAWNLHELTRDLDLSAFILFSSVAGTLGSPGQGNYAAANASLDALAAHRRSLGLTGTSIAWGLWEQATEITGQLGALDQRRIGKTGIFALSNEQGLKLLDEVLKLDQALTISARLDLKALRAQARSGTLSPLFSGLVQAPSRRSSKDRANLLASRVSSSGEAERERLALEVTLAHTAAVLGHTSPGAIAAGRTFKDLGFDSLAAVELRNRLSEEVGSPLPATLVFDHPTPRAVARHLLSQIAGGGAQSTLPEISAEAELADLERRLSAIASDASGRATVAARLQAFLAGLAGQEGVPGEDEQLRSATAQEVFELIDRDLGPLEHDGGAHAIG